MSAWPQVGAIARRSIVRTARQPASVIPPLRLSAAVPVGLGTLAYLAYWWAKVGDWLAPVDQQANWQRTFSWPWATLADGSRDAFRYLGNANGGYWLIDWLIVVPVVGASVFALLRYRPSYSLYVWGGLLIPLSFVFAESGSAKLVERFSKVDST